MSPETFTRAVLPRLSGPEHDDAREQARRRGHALGHAEGMRRAHEEAARDRVEAERRRRADAESAAAAGAAARAGLHAAASAFEARAAELAEVSQRQVISAAVELAELILERELSESVTAALTAAHRVRLAVGAGGDPATVVLCPADLATLEALGERLGEQTPLTVTTSSELAPGDAIVRFRDGEIDLRVAAALARARDALSEAPG